MPRLSASNVALWAEAAHGVCRRRCCLILCCPQGPRTAAALSERQQEKEKEPLAHYMSVAAAHQRRKFVGLIDDFKRLGAPASIVQFAKLKVFNEGQAKVFLNVQEARKFLELLKKQGDGA
ncbi:hypothetical protein NDU88_002783 [Pleurodeles waltl]|uniref:Uncharacterized protein n=1 Tax=Pleurodeles waltl TaxID=8319 RepID=A0AAV7MSP1_PLEWA|nr:hypothetical protein NDU88_002783 [Pleurodeles waltl]